MKKILLQITVILALGQLKIATRDELAIKTGVEIPMNTVLHNKNKKNEEITANRTEVINNIEENLVKGGLSLDEIVRSHTNGNRLMLFDKNDLIHTIPSGYITNSKVYLSNDTFLGEYAGSFNSEPTNAIELPLAIQLIGANSTWHNFPVYIKQTKSLTTEEIV